MVDLSSFVSPANDENEVDEGKYPSCFRVAVTGEWKLRFNAWRGFFPLPLVVVVVVVAAVEWLAAAWRKAGEGRRLF